VVDLASVDQVIALAAADIDAVPVVAVEGKARDGQRLELGAGFFDPVPAAASRLNHSGRAEHSWNVNPWGLGVSSRLGRSSAEGVTSLYESLLRCWVDTRFFMLGNVPRRPGTSSG
jgi:hypothetical protein